MNDDDDDDVEDPFDDQLFRQRLESTLDMCHALGNSSLWIHVPMTRARLIEDMVALGLRFHHDERMTDVLRKHNFDNENIRKQKYIGTRKCNSEAVAKTSHKHVAKDSDGSTTDDSSENIQGTTLPRMVGDEVSIECGDGFGKQRGNKSGVVEPRSYRDVLVNGGKICQMMT